MNKILIFVVSIFSLSTWSQTEFFRSKINFSENQLVEFYSSISIDSSQIYFIANDYNLYAHNKKTGVIQWKQYLANKTNTTPKVFQNTILVSKHFDENTNRTIQLSDSTGDTIQTLNIDALETKPYFKGEIMYCAAISPKIGGAILAYDLKKNAIVWQKFIAHGCSIQPYFFENKIVANAESNNWFEIDYNGKLIDTTCSKKTDLFVEDIKCIRFYRFLTHDQKEIPELFFQKNMEDSYEVTVKYDSNKTFVLGNKKLLILGNNKKIRNTIEISKLIPSLETGLSEYREILKIEGDTIWFFYENILVEYNYTKNKTIKTIDLSKWNPHQVILDNDTLWLISRVDGQLYGLKID